MKSESKICLLGAVLAGFVWGCGSGEKPVETARGEAEKSVKAGISNQVPAVVSGVSEQKKPEEPNPAAVSKRDDQETKRVAQANLPTTSPLSVPLAETSKNMPEIASLRSVLESELNAEKTGHANVGKIRKLRRELAKAGDPIERRRIIQNLSSTDLVAQSHAIEDAAMVGDKQMIANLASLLDHQGPGGRMTYKDEQGKTAYSSLAFYPPRIAVAQELAKLVENPPIPPIGAEKKFYTEEDVEKWRTWWSEHRKEYPSVDGSGDNTARGQPQTAPNEAKL